MRINVICVDEFEITKTELDGILKKLNLSIVSAKNETEAVNLLRSNKYNFSAIIWTINSVNLEDFESIKRLKSRELSRNIPILIISIFTDKKHIIKAIEAGAVEYIAKPYDEAVVINKVAKVLGIYSPKTRKKEIDEDFITFNFSEMFDREIKLASRGNHKLSLMLVSLLEIAPYGRTQSKVDETVNLLARILRTKLRATDTVFQYGSTNLMLLLPFTDKGGAASVKNKIFSIFNFHTMIKDKSAEFKLAAADVTFPDDGRIKDKLLELLEGKFAEDINVNKERLRI